MPAANYSNLKYFQGRKAYDDFYNKLVGIGDIGVITFANRAQALLVDYLPERYGETCADWCRDFWTGKRG